MERRSLMRGAGAAAAVAALPAPALSQGAAARTIRVVPQANLTSLDPVWTTAVVTRNHGFMVYDQLLAQDARGEIRPQMVEGWATEPEDVDRLVDAWSALCRRRARALAGPGRFAQRSGRDVWRCPEGTLSVKTQDL